MHNTPSYHVHSTTMSYFYEYTRIPLYDVMLFLTLDEVILGTRYKMGDISTNGIYVTYKTYEIDQDEGDNYLGINMLMFGDIRIDVKLFGDGVITTVGPRTEEEFAMVRNVIRNKMTSLSGRKEEFLVEYDTYGVPVIHSSRAVNTRFILDATLTRVIGHISSEKLYIIDNLVHTRHPSLPIFVCHDDYSVRNLLGEVCGSYDSERCTKNIKLLEATRKPNDIVVYRTAEFGDSSIFTFIITGHLPVADRCTYMEYTCLDIVFSNRFITRIHNIHASSSWYSRIDLYRLSEKLHSLSIPCTFVPHRDIALHIRCGISTVSVFANGAVTVSGHRSLEKVEASLTEVFALLSRCVESSLTTRRLHNRPSRCSKLTLPMKPRSRFDVSSLTSWK